MNAAGKLRQEWQARAGTKFTKPGASLYMYLFVWTYQNVIALIAVCEAVDHVAQTTPLHQGVITHLNLILMRSLIL